MVNETCIVTVDAFPHGLSLRNEDITREEKDSLNSILDDFTTEQFKSIFFLLIDYINEEDDFFTITKQEKPKLKEKFREIIEKCGNELLIEILGTLKMYKHLKVFGTCSHIFKNCQQTKFNKIDNIWKMLFLLCEEITADDLILLRDLVPSHLSDQIVVAEDYFFLAFKRKDFSKNNVSKLKKIFSRHPVCSKIIQGFEASLNRYPVKTPTATSHCGIALIFNFDEFDKELNLRKREGSDIDVRNLINLWSHFGFKTETFTNLTCEETFNELQKCASLDHTDYDVFVCCFLSHGLSNSVLSSDGVKMPIPMLQAQVINYSNSLGSKPKLFFIQACQGDYILEGVGKPIYRIVSATESLKDCAVGMEIPPIKCDVLSVVSSIDGYVSFREPERGSWFINAVCNAMMTSGDKKSILDVMTDANNDVRKKVAYFEHGKLRMASQIAECAHTLDKTLILKKRMC